MSRKTIPVADREVLRRLCQPWSPPRCLCHSRGGPVRTKSISPRVGMNSFCALLQREKNSGDVVWNKVLAICDGNAVYQAAAIFDSNPAFRYQLQGQWINPVLDLEHPHGEGVFAVNWSHRDRALRDNRSGIHF